MSTEVKRVFLLSHTVNKPDSRWESNIIQHRKDKVYLSCMWVFLWLHLYMPPCACSLDANLTRFQRPGSLSCSSNASHLRTVITECQLLEAISLSAIIWWVRTVSHWQLKMIFGLSWSWLLNVGLAPDQSSGPPGPNNTHGPGHRGRTVGPTGHWGV